MISSNELFLVENKSHPMIRKEESHIFLDQ